MGEIIDMDRLDPRVDYDLHEMIHKIQVNESIHLSDNSRSDIYEIGTKIAKYWKKELDKIRFKNHALRWNELRQWLKREEPEGFDVILEVMERLDNKRTIR
ncbi:hypothetical protein Q7A53_05140 [Halobacillus rhizosphaerae]|uniref:hypothetical protein n=1 Tax=Halobacillus rhizosphaerae TaxID=3064889 RepID=UPI00398A9B0D